MPSVEELFARLPEGWTEVELDGRRWGATRTTAVGGRVQRVWAEELGGTRTVSANLYEGGRLQPCEMPADVVLDFLTRWTPVTSGTSRSAASHPMHT